MEKIMDLNKKEKAWLERFKSTMAAAPSSLNNKIGSFTIGDRDITLFDKQKFDTYITKKNEEAYGYYDEQDKGIEVQASDSEIMVIMFPFHVESTAG